MNDAHLTETDTLALVRGEPVSSKALEHRERCPDCAARVTEQTELWNTLGSVAPSPRSETMWDIVETRLTPPLAGRRRVKTLPWAFAAALVLSLGLASWWQISSLRARITHLESSNTGLALGHGSASVRVAAIADLAVEIRDEGTDRSLLQLLRTDPNEHVRLLALEALGGALDSGAVSAEELVGFLTTEPSPLVQSDLIVWILRIGGAEMLPAIREALPPTAVHPFVAGQITET